MDSAGATEVLGGERRPSIARLVGSLRKRLGEEAPAQSLSVAAALLFGRHLRFDAADGRWPDRDRLVLGPGLERLGAALAGLTGAGGEVSQACGQGVGAGVGLALAERLLTARFGRSLVDHRCWVLADGADLASGAVQEAAWLAAAWRLGRLTLIVAVESEHAAGLANVAASGWSVRRVAAGDAGEVAGAMSAALRSHKPTLIACIRAAGPRSLGVEAADPEAGNAAWAATGRRMAGVRRAWLKRLARHASRADFDDATSGRLQARWHSVLSDPGTLLPFGQSRVSTGWMLRQALGKLVASMPELVALPGDPAWVWPALPADQPAASGLVAGRLALGCVAASCGLTLHGGVLPLLVQRLDQAEAVRPGLQMAAAARLRVVVLLNEDAAGVGGVQGRLSGLRAMRNVAVFRPADATEALECCELALRRIEGPSVVVLSESPAALLAERPSRTRCARGGYVVTEPARPRAVSLIASGPEVGLAIEVASYLARVGVPAAIVSLPCWDLFAAQEDVAQQAVLGSALRVGLEAGCGFGWERWLGPRGVFIGVGAATVAPDVAAMILRQLGRPGAGTI